MTDQEKNDVQEEMCIAESLLLKTIDFELEMKSPYMFTKEFTECLYPIDKYGVQT